MPSSFPLTVWNWLRARVLEWNATSLLPPRAEPLRWPHRVKLYLLLAASLTLSTFLIFFVLFFDLFFTGLHLLPPPLTVGSFLHAVVSCWQMENGSHSIGLELAFGPLWLVTYIWNWRAARLTRQNAALAAPTGTIWPPPPTRPDA